MCFSSMKKFVRRLEGEQVCPSINSVDPAESESYLEREEVFPSISIDLESPTFV